jgi:hypothetical protein
MIDCPSAPGVPENQKLAPACRRARSTRARTRGGERVLIGKHGQIVQGSVRVALRRVPVDDVCAGGGAPDGCRMREQWGEEKYGLRTLCS